MGTSELPPEEIIVCVHLVTSMFYKNTDGNYAGIEYDLLTKIEKNSGLKMVYKETPFADLFLNTKEHLCDIAVGTIAATPERLQYGIFSDLFMFVNQSILIRSADKESLSSIKNFSGRKIGIVPFTTGELYARRDAPEDAIFVPFENENDMVQELLDKRIDCIARGEPGNNYQAMNNASLLVPEVRQTKEPIRFLVSNHRSDLVTIINNAIKPITNESFNF